MSVPREETRRTGRRPALNRERIETAALSLIEELGLEEFSMRKLGKALGCEPMSLYHYFPGKAELFDALVDRLIAGFQFPETVLPVREAIRAMAVQWRSIALAHPRFFPFLALHRMNSETGVRFLNRILGHLREGGLDDETAARVFRVVNYYLVGAALDEISGYARGDSSLDPVSPETIASDYPALAAASPFFSAEHFERTFEFGLQLLLGERRLAGE